MARRQVAHQADQAATGWRELGQRSVRRQVQRFVHSQHDALARSRERQVETARGDRFGERLATLYRAAGEPTCQIGSPCRDDRRLGEKRAIAVAHLDASVLAVYRRHLGARDDDHAGIHSQSGQDAHELGPSPIEVADTVRGQLELGNSRARVEEVGCVRVGAEAHEHTQELLNIVRLTMQPCIHRGSRELRWLHPGQAGEQRSQPNTTAATEDWIAQQSCGAHHHRMDRTIAQDPDGG